MAQEDSSMNEYERLLIDYQPAIANRDRMIREHCGNVLYAVEPKPHPPKGRFAMFLYRLLRGRGEDG